MIKKGTKSYSIIKMKCPSCQEGDFFEGHPYKFKTMGKVKSNCPNCAIKYSIEPGFYQGSYYVTYALSVASFIITWVLCTLFFDLGPLKMIAIIVIVQMLLAPLLFALSKIIWANMFLKFKKGTSHNLS